MEYNFKEIEAKWQQEWKERGIYKVEIDPRDPAAMGREKRVIHYLYQQVMTSLRLAQMRDQEQAAGGVQE